MQELYRLRDHPTSGFVTTSSIIPFDTPNRNGRSHRETIFVDLETSIAPDMIGDLYIDIQAPSNFWTEFNSAVTPVDEYVEDQNSTDTSSGWQEWSDDSSSDSSSDSSDD